MQWGRGARKLYLLNFLKEIEIEERRKHTKCGNLPQGKQTTPACTRKWAIFIPHG
jgi:hypothetical protein